MNLARSSVRNGSRRSCGMKVGSLRELSVPRSLRNATLETRTLAKVAALLERRPFASSALRLVLRLGRLGRLELVTQPIEGGFRGFPELAYTGTYDGRGPIRRSPPPREGKDMKQGRSFGESGLVPRPIAHSGSKRIAWVHRVFVAMLVLSIAACSEGDAEPSEMSSQTRLLTVDGATGEPLPLDGSSVSGTVDVVLEQREGVAEVHFFLDAPERTEDPVAIDSDAPFGMTLDTRTLENGAHTLTAVATGLDRTSVLVVSNATFSVANEAAQIPIGDRATFTLIDAATDQPVDGYDPMTEGATIDLSEMDSTGLNVVFSTDDANVGSVRFELNGVTASIENSAPWALAGDTEGDFKSWTPGVGRYTLTATPFGRDDAQGDEGSSTTIIFQVVGGEPVEPSPDPEPEPEPGGGGAFFEQGGQLVVESEHYDTRSPSKYLEYEHVHTWELKTDIVGASGSGFMQVLPDERGVDGVGPSSPRDASGAEMTYPIEITTPGTYRVWVRGYSMGGESNGVHVGVDGAIAGTGSGASNMSGFRPHAQWIWENGRKDEYTQPATLDLTEGAHTLHVWNRDDAFRIDKMLLTLSDAVPTGQGPAESARASDGGSETPPPDGGGNVFSAADGETLLNGQPFRVAGLRTSNALMSDEATQQLIDNMDTFAGYGVNTFSVFLQGSRFGDVRGYLEDATLDPTYAGRLARIIEAADARGMVVLVGCLYYGTSDNKWASWTQSDANRAVANTVRWLEENGYRSVFLDPDNEAMASRKTGWSIEQMISAGKAVDSTYMIGWNSWDPPPANADVLLHYSPRDGVRPYVESEGAPADYWGSYSKQDGLYNYINVGIYDDDMKSWLIRDTSEHLDGSEGYMIGSTWLQAVPSKGPNHHPGGIGTDSDPGIRWWLEHLSNEVGPYRWP